MEECPTVFNCLQKYLQYMYNIEKLTQWRNFKSLFILLIMLTVM